MTRIIKKLSIIILLLTSFLAQAQINQFEWGTEVGISGFGVTVNNSKLIGTDTAGNVYISNTFNGTTLTVGDTTYTGLGGAAVKMFTAKIDENGHTEWMRMTIGQGGNVPQPNGLIVDSNGDCYIVGNAFGNIIIYDGTTISGSATSSNFALKINSNGNLDWGTMIAGQSTSPDIMSIDLHNKGLRIGGNAGIFYTKLDAQTGALLFQYPTSSPLDAHHITTDNQGNNYMLDYDGNDQPFVIGGFAYTPLPPSFGAGMSSMIVKQDSSANTMWVKQFETEDFTILGMDVDNNGSLYVLGVALDSVQLDSNTAINDYVPNNRDYFIAKFDQNLQVIWYKLLGGIAANTNSPWGYDSFLELDPAGNAYVAVSVSSNQWIGNSQLIVPNNDVTSAVIKLAPNGDIVWVKSVKGYSNGPLGLTISPKGVFLYGSVEDGSVIFNNKTITAATNAPIGFVTRLSNSSATNSVKGLVFYDSNANGSLDTSEAGMPNRLVNFNNDFYKSTDNQGYFTSYLPEGTHTVSPGLPKYWEHTTQDTTFAFSNPWSSVSGLEFGIRPLDDVQDLEVYLASTRIRPGFDMTYYLTYRNVGTKMMSGQLELMMDDTLIYLSSTPMGVLAGPTVSWSYDSLQVGETRVARVFCKMPVALGLLGTDLSATARVQPISSDTTPLNNIFIHDQEITGSYDPNDKRATPSGVVDTNFINDGTFLYTIRFQNTGNDTAFTVRVADTLSTHLDVGSFQMISASHGYDFELNDRAIMWTFNTILLPDSTTNEPASHGFIQYSIRPKTTTILNDTIANTAHIYFDFNPAIITNTTINDVQLISNVTKFKDSQLETINIFPNPTKGQLTCEIENYQDNENYRFRVFDMTGRKVHEEMIFSNHQTMNLSSFSKGMYIFQIINKNNTLKGIGKILIQ